MVYVVTARNVAASAFFAILIVIAIGVLQCVPCLAGLVVLVLFAFFVLWAWGLADSDCAYQEVCRKRYEANKCKKDQCPKKNVCEKAKCEQNKCGKESCPYKGKC